MEYSRHQKPGLKRRVLIDASSAIILAKVGLLKELLECYCIIMAQAAYSEVTIHPLPGSSDIMELVASEKISVRIPSQSYNQENGMPAGCTNFGQGELETLQLYHDGEGDFIIVDDGDAAKYCLQQHIPFINALLFPVVLEAAGIQSTSSRDHFIKKIAQTGRYSSTVFSFVHTCSREKIAFFMP